MNMLALLNPADDLVSERSIGSAESVHTHNSVLVVETHVDDSSVARSLMMLGTNDEEVSRSSQTSPPLADGYPPDARSPVVLPSHAANFHMSPVASKSVPVALWTTPQTSDLAPICPAPPLLRRRLSSISSMLNELELPSSCELSFVSWSPSASAMASPEFCSVTGCLRRRSLQNQGKCAVHKGMKLCQIDGCFRPVQSRGCCKSHGGGARCKFPDCAKGAISKGRCRTHGGGTRCAVADCAKWAQRFGCCVRHSKSVTPTPPLV